MNTNDGRASGRQLDDELLRHIIEQETAAQASPRGARRTGLAVNGGVPTARSVGSVGSGGAGGGMQNGAAHNENGSSGGFGCGNGNGSSGSIGNGSNGGMGNGNSGIGNGNSCIGNGNSCIGNGSNGGSWGLYGYPLAMVYAPVQCFDELYEPAEGLAGGTIFRRLELPLEVRGGCRQ